MSIATYVTESRVAQGLPAKVEDDAALVVVAHLLDVTEPAPARDAA